MNDLIKQETELLKGLVESKAAQIKAVFQPMVVMLENFEEKYTEIIALDISPDKCKQAKRLRIDISRVRIDADKVRGEQKAEYIRAGNAIQGVYNILKYAVTDKEEKLKDVELHYEKIEEEKKAKLQIDRALELSRYEASGDFVDLGNMPDEVWTNYLAGVKNNYEAGKEAERKAEADRIAKIEADEKETYRLNKMYELGLKYNGESFIYKDINFHWTDLLCMTDEDFEKAHIGAEKRKLQIEKEEAEEQAKIKADNDRLKLEADKAEKKRLADEKKQASKLKTERDKAAAESKKQADILKAEQDKAAAERLEQELKLKTEREAREKLEREAKEKADREAAEAKKAAKAPDKEKLFSVATKLRNTKTTVKSPEAKKALEDAALILEKVAGVM